MILLAVAVFLGVVGVCDLLRAARDTTTRARRGANLVVRLVLDAVGAPATSHERQLKGGRLLGPMERILILGLGAIGQFTAAAVVMGAKGLLRFPELQEGVRTRTYDHSDVSEYVLIGSFASWLIALAGVALIYLA